VHSAQNERDGVAFFGSFQDGLLDLLFYLAPLEAKN
jgi:hypothetical protein